MRSSAFSCFTSFDFQINRGMFVGAGSKPALKILFCWAGLEPSPSSDHWNTIGIKKAYPQYPLRKAADASSGNKGLENK